MKPIGPHHLAHMRAVAEGIDVAAAAQKYLAIEDFREAQTAHNELTARLRLVARRKGYRHHRLIGIRFREKLRQSTLPSPAAPRPTLDEFIETKDLDGFSFEEQLEYYLAEHPEPTPSKLNVEAVLRRERTRKRVLAMLHAMEADGTTTPPSETDTVDAWLPEILSKKLIAGGFVTLDALARAIRVGGRWYRGLPGIGPQKADEIRRRIETLLPGRTVKRSEVLTLNETVPAHSKKPFDTPAFVASDLSGQNLAGIADDVDAMKTWIRSTTRSPATARSYEREARRFLFWVATFRAGYRLADLNMKDVESYRTFLAHVPEEWISRVRASPGMPGWTPFRGQLSSTSQRQALIVLTGWFKWLVDARYLNGNPFSLVLKDGQIKTDEAKRLEGKALNQQALVEVAAFLSCVNSAESRRALFAVQFLSATGLRSVELVKARFGDLHLEGDMYLLRVIGKRDKERLVVLSSAAEHALQVYASERGFTSIKAAPPDAPLFSTIENPMEAASYETLYRCIKTWLARALDASSLSQAERARVVGISGHWLRHSYTTNALSAGMATDVVQEQLGHENPATLRIYSRTLIDRRIQEVRKIFG